MLRLLDKNNSKSIEKAVEILVDLKFDLWNQYQIDVSIGDALNELKNTLKEQGIKNLKRYFKPIVKKINKELNRKYKEKEKHSSYIFVNQYQELIDDRDFQEENDEDSEDIDLISHYQTDHKQGNNEPKTYDNCPPSLHIWVTASLVGLFVTVLPVPGAQAIGRSILSYSAVKCAEIIIEKQDEDFKRKKEEEEEYSDCSICEEKGCPYHEERKREREIQNERNRRRHPR